ncbi:MAG: UDP-N-acetylmuramoyl-tripeptide--D-alanyl-D-alanine ligase [Acidobacteriaceae bacterium]|nr:UDP-N-acetylmuramoyl-tripeptide--D-alanyl-D-alanine ligase [Acidobacteriaceae bacterium]MBV9779543.1 UDP-N-acetylmuramoyl-tripeptide--D-alanyl-D-alanine ligase [Acidobacteriaceae bacterium]
MEFSLAQVEAALSARRHRPSATTAPADLRVHGWSTDSRTVRAGDLFFALKGDRYDGHAFANAALKLGAVAAVVSDRVDTSGGMLLEVADTLDALQKLARWARRKWGRPIVAITGSAGKTTTKDIIAQLLSVRFRVGKTVGNLNNHIGVPLSILRIPADADVAVLELAMNHPGEIGKLAAIAKPQIGVVTNVGFAHVEAFDSIEQIAAAKRELIDSLPATGIAVLNADDERVAAFRAAHSGSSLTYGLSAGADVRATDVEMSPEGTEFNARGVRFHTKLAGRHNLLNILAGLAVVSIFDIDVHELVSQVAALAPGEMRGERRMLRGVTVLNDCYNSNPEAARGMIDVLRNEPAQRRIAVLGEMLELGLMSEALHRELGRYAANSGIDVLIGVRGVSRFMVEEAKIAGLNDHAAYFFEEAEEAGSFLRAFARAGDAILFKGSRGTHVERALARMEA